MPATPRLKIVATVGMSSWPFDRLLGALEPLCVEHDVFAQTGTSRVRPPCPSAPYVDHAALLHRMAGADVIITHAGNTVRLVQRLGKVPIAVARTAAHREMPNDHQVEYLRREERVGRVVAVWDVADLAGAVSSHREVEPRLLGERALPPPADGRAVADLLDALWVQLAGPGR